MNSARSQAWKSHVLLSIALGVLALARPADAVAQGTGGGDLFRLVDRLTLDEILSDGTRAVGGTLLSVHGDTAVVATLRRGISCCGSVHVLERDPADNAWLQTATLVLSDQTAVPGSTATDGRTIVVGAGRAAYLFQRGPGETWHEVAKLTGHTNDSLDSVVVSVAVSGRTVLVGAPHEDPGIAYVFEQEGDDSQAWREVGRLAGPPAPESNDSFGIAVSIDRDTAVVAAFFGDDEERAYVFSRQYGVPEAWGRVAALSINEFSQHSPPVVSISGHTVVTESGVTPSVVTCASLNEIEAVRTPGARFRGSPSPAGLADFNHSLSGDRLIVTAGVVGEGPVGYVYARSQGGKDGWGEVAQIDQGRFSSGEVSVARAVGISGDTVFLGSVGNPGQRPPGPLDNGPPIYVYVADIDRDGLRDGIDACPRDPLNNVEGGCTRTSAAYLVLDDLITLGDVATETRGDEFHITATFTNTSDTAIANPFFEVTDLTGGNLLVNADAGPGGTGATLSPDVGDGILSPGEPTTVTFVIGLATREAFSFYVSVRGDAGP